MVFVTIIISNQSNFIRVITSGYPKQSFFVYLNTIMLNIFILGYLKTWICEQDQSKYEHFSKMEKISLFTDALCVADNRNGDRKWINRVFFPFSLSISDWFLFHD